MKKINKISLGKSILLVFTITSLVLAFNSCARKTSFVTSEVIPAARGNVTVKSDKNKNRVISISLTYLSEPERLTPPKKLYVVWLVTKDDAVQNIGQIKTSNGLKATFQAISSFKPKRIFLTAEDDADIVAPVSEAVLTTNNF